MSNAPSAQYRCAWCDQKSTNRYDLAIHAFIRHQEECIDFLLDVAAIDLSDVWMTVIPGHVEGIVMEQYGQATRYEAAQLVSTSDDQIRVVAAVMDPVARWTREHDWDEDGFRVDVRNALQSRGYGKLDNYPPGPYMLAWNPGRDQAEEEQFVPQADDENIG